MSLTYRSCCGNKWFLWRNLYCHEQFVRHIAAETMGLWYETIVYTVSRQCTWQSNLTKYMNGSKLHENQFHHNRMVVELYLVLNSVNIFSNNTAMSRARWTYWFMFFTNDKQRWFRIWVGTMSVNEHIWLDRNIKLKICGVKPRLTRLISMFKYSTFTQMKLLWK